MKITRNELMEQEILADIAARFPERKEIHWSHLNYCLIKAYWRIQAARGKADKVVEDGGTLLNFGNGAAWQILLQGEDKGDTWELDGIKLSPDWVRKGILYIEVKSTSAYPSTKAEPIEEERILKNETWMRQAMAYAYAGAALACCSEQLLHVHSPELPIKGVVPQNTYFYGLCVIHDLGFQKMLRFWNLEFTKEELLANWRWGLNRRDVLQEALDKSLPPGLEYGEAWECKNCSVKKDGRCVGKE